MVTKKIFLIAVLGLLALAFSRVGFAQGPSARLARMKNSLALSDQQVNDIRDLLKKHQQAAFPLRQELRARNHDLQNTLDSPEPNPNAVGQLVIARHSLRTQLRALGLKAQSDIAAKLTPDQRQKFQQLRARQQRVRAKV